MAFRRMRDFVISPAVSCICYCDTSTSARTGKAFFPDMECVYPRGAAGVQCRGCHIGVCSEHADSEQGALCSAPDECDAGAFQQSSSTSRIFLAANRGPITSTPSARDVHRGRARRLQTYAFVHHSYILCFRSLASPLDRSIPHKPWLSFSGGRSPSFPLSSRRPKPSKCPPGASRLKQHLSSNESSPTRNPPHPSASHTAIKMPSSKPSGLPTAHTRLLHRKIRSRRGILRNAWSTAV
nr:hypothetical protein CFP56_03872 [Quercus suber]